MVFICESLVKTEKALFQSDLVLISILGPHGLDFGTVLGQNVSNMYHETVFEKTHVFHTLFD